MLAFLSRHLPVPAAVAVAALIYALLALLVFLYWETDQAAFRYFEI